MSPADLENAWSATLAISRAVLHAHLQWEGQTEAGLMLQNANPNGDCLRPWWSRGIQFARPAADHGSVSPPSSMVH